MYQSPPTMHSEAMKLETLIDISRNSLIYLIVALSIILIGVDFTFNTSCIWQLKYALYNVISKVFAVSFNWFPLAFVLSCLQYHWHQHWQKQISKTFISRSNTLPRKMLNEGSCVISLTQYFHWSFTRLCHPP